MKYRFLLGIILSSFVFGVYFLRHHPSLPVREARLNLKDERVWKGLIAKTLQSSKDQRRLILPNTAQRGLASEEAPLIISNGKRQYQITKGSIINIEKNKDKTPQNRLFATNAGLGKTAVLSGEIVVVTEQIENIPGELEGITFERTRRLGKNRYLLTISPPTEIQRALSIIQETAHPETLTVDVVDREIVPR